MEPRELQLMDILVKRVNTRVRIGCHQLAASDAITLSQAYLNNSSRSIRFR